MNFFALIGIFLMNAIIVLSFYFQLFFYEILLFLTLFVLFLIEYKERSFEFVDDDRKVI